MAWILHVFSKFFSEMRRQRIAASSKRSPPDLEASTSEPLGIGVAPSDNRNQARTLAATTTKHPRHRPGCTCIVCIQPPSGKGPKHKQTCTCNVCLTVKRRFRTLMLRREKRQSEREAEAARKQQQIIQSPEMLPASGNDPSSAGPSISSSQKAVVNNDGAEEGSEYRKTSPSPLKAQIDLNIQPEREEEPSPKSDTGGMMRLLRDAAS